MLMRVRPQIFHVLCRLHSPVLSHCVHPDAWDMPGPRSRRAGCVARLEQDKEQQPEKAAKDNTK